MINKIYSSTLGSILIKQKEYIHIYIIAICFKGKKYLLKFYFIMQHSYHRGQYIVYNDPPTFQYHFCGTICALFENIQLVAKFLSSEHTFEF